MNNDLEIMALEAMIGGVSAIENQSRREQVKVRNSSKLPIKCNFTSSKDYYKILKRMGIKIINRDDDLFYNTEIPDGWHKESAGGYWSYLIDDKGRKRASMFYKGAFYDRDAFISFNRKYGISSEIPDYDEKLFEPQPRYIQDGFKTVFIDRNGNAISDKKINILAEEEDCWGEYIEDEHGRIIMYTMNSTYEQVQEPNYIENPKYDPLDVYKKYSQPFHYEVEDYDDTILFKSDIVKTSFEYSADKHWDFFHHRDDIKKQAKQQCIDWLNNNYPCWQQESNYWDNKSCIVLGKLKNKTNNNF